MLKIACFFTGDNFYLISNDTPSSKKKITALALAMLVPILLWVFNGFLLSYLILQAGLIYSIVTALVCGLLIFLIEKLIIMANGNGWLNTFRIFIGFIIAALGSIVMDEVIFKDDIDAMIQILKKESVLQAQKLEEKEFKHNNNYEKKEKEIINLTSSYNEAVISVVAEADGTTGSKKRGVGDITKLKEKSKNVIRKDLVTSSQILKDLDKQKNIAIFEVGQKVQKSFNEHALLIRIKALFSLVVSDIYMASAYVLFTLLLFFFEFLVVILKITWKKTNYERKLEMFEQIGEERIRYLLRKGSPVYDLGTNLRQLDNAQNSLNRKSSLFK